MSYKNFKSAVALCLTFVFLFTMGFSNFSFAAAASDGQQTVTEGVYSIRNEMSGSYLNALDSMSVVLCSQYESPSFQWELIYVSNGYYYIRNVGNGKYLTAPANSNEGSVVELASLNSLISNRQLWSIESVYYGDMFFYIRSQSQEYANLYTASSDYMGVYGHNVVQSYDAQFKYNNEWTLEREYVGTERPVATLLGISPYDTTHNHTSPIVSAGDSLTNANYLTNVFAPINTNKSNVLTYLQNSDVFIMYTHGYTTSSGTHAYLNEYNSAIISSNDIYNYNTGTHIDISRCDIAIFASCYSSAHSSKNLPLAAVQAGAECAIGFNEEIDCEELSGWIGEFLIYYMSGIDAEDAAIFAERNVSGTIYGSVDIYKQGG